MIASLGTNLPPPIILKWLLIWKFTLYYLWMRTPSKLYPDNVITMNTSFLWLLIHSYAVFPHIMWLQGRFIDYIPSCDIPAIHVRCFRCRTTAVADTCVIYMFHKLKIYACITHVYHTCNASVGCTPV